MSERIALVTGASSGIGAATARALAALGWPVALCARREDRLAEVAREIEAVGGTSCRVVCDVSRADSIDACFDAVEKELGAPDVVVSNAGVSIPGLLHEQRVEDLEHEIATNLTGAMLVARRALPALLKAGRGDLVFVSSENAVSPRPYQPAYSAAKAGVEALAAVLRMELDGTGVRATVVRPGPTGSEFGSRWDHGLLHRVLASWKHWGLQRDLRWLPAESVAHAVVGVVTAPPGTHWNVVQVMPEGSGRRREGETP